MPRIPPESFETGRGEVLVDFEVALTEENERLMLLAYLVYQATLSEILKREPDYVLASTSYYDSLPWGEAEAAFLGAWKKGAEAALRAGWGAGVSLADPLLVSAGGVGAARASLSASFALDNPFVQAWIDGHSARLVTEVLAPTREAIKQALAGGYSAHNTTQETARLLRGYRSATGEVHRGIIGLRTDQILATDRYLQQLRQQGFPPDKALDAVGRYAKTLHDERAMLVARSEIIAAQEGGKDLSWAEANRRGHLLPQTVRIWIASPGEKRTCPRCAALHQTTAPMDGTFAGGASAPPLHPHCRCSLALYTNLQGTTFRKPEPLTDDQLRRVVERYTAHRTSQASKRAAWKRRGAKGPK